MIPLTHRRSFEVADGVACAPPNHLPLAVRGHDRFVVIGGGKTGLDCVSWLIDSGAASESIHWVITRDAWWVERRALQTDQRLYAGSLALMRRQSEAMAAASSIRDLCEGLEQAGFFVRLDRFHEPTMYHAATTTAWELKRASQCRLIRDGYVVAIHPDHLLLAGGSLPTTGRTLYVDCTASALAHARFDKAPVFQPGRINLQVLRFPAVCLSAALIGFIEASITDDDARGG